MKNKRVLIMYLGNGNVKSEIAKELMFNRMVNEMIEEGREVKNSLLQPKTKSITFDDGSKLMLFPFSNVQKGFRVTHIFLDAEIAFLPNGDKLINEKIKPCIINGEREDFDTSGKQLLLYSFADNELKIN